MRREPPGIGLGLDRGELFSKTLKEEKVKLESGDTLMLFSDGLSEAENPKGEELGEEALEKLLQENGNMDAASTGEAILKRIQEFAGNRHQKDDMTLVIIKSTRMNKNKS